MRWLRMQRWSPYAAGALIGLLSWFSFLSVDKPIGVSTAIAKTTGMVEKTVAAEHVGDNPYFKKFPPLVDWEWMLVAGLALGAFVSSRLSGDRPSAAVPELWRRRFGSSTARRYAGAFVGGLLLMVGARVAGGCTSGHGISGSLQLALSGWVFFLSIFASGVLAAAMLYGKEANRG